MKFDAETNSNMLTSKVMSTFFILDPKYHFREFGPKKQNCLFGMKIGT